MGVTVTVIADVLVLLSACFEPLACGGMMATVDLVISEMRFVSTIVGFEGSDGFDAEERTELREAAEAMVVGKRAGVGDCGSLGRGVYSIMAY
jgi:hypothetical protein